MFIIHMWLLKTRSSCTFMQSAALQLRSKKKKEKEVPNGTFSKGEGDAIMTILTPPPPSVSLFYLASSYPEISVKWLQSCDDDVCFFIHLHLNFAQNLCNCTNDSCVMHTIIVRTQDYHTYITNTEWAKCFCAFIHVQCIINIIFFMYFHIYM